MDIDNSDDRGLALSPYVRRHLGAGLKSIYDDIVEQPVPDRMLDLLARLEMQHESQEKQGDRLPSSAISRPGYKA